MISEHKCVKNQVRLPKEFDQIVCDICTQLFKVITMLCIFQDLFVNLTQFLLAPNFRGIAADGCLGGFSESIHGFNRNRRRQRKGGNAHHRCKNMKL